MNLIVRENTILFLIGDLNVNLSHNNELSLDAEKFKNIFFSHHPFPLINIPTRETNHTATVIDNMFCNVPSPIDTSHVGILHPYISDHHGIFSVINSEKQKQNQHSYVKRNFTNKSIKASSHQYVQSCRGNHGKINYIIYKYQFGFRQKHSTQQAIISLVIKITPCIDSGDLLIGVFLDLKKAFDTVITPYLLERCMHMASEVIFLNGLKSTSQIYLSMLLMIVSNRIHIFSIVEFHRALF